MYLLLLAVGHVFSYLLLYFLFPVFFRSGVPTIGWRSLRSVAYIVVAYLSVLFVSFAASDPEWSNRILHIFGGGFVSLSVCFLVVSDTHLRISRFQFIVFSILVVTGLGVANEITEFFLQNYLGFVFAEGVNDTWLDLISNVCGALIATLCLTPLLTSGTKS
ncbi:MAG: hypothetical protein A3C93_00870 [Candidatus Lloydbacteria bacterium RIFCSPHIGHO2_02_FULL_54_17]|uniref:VanZ-like domain-containing protein n=1 Tax=Candidatus Lloydbacteria bacterium RIFCSPHIGHO2_02_FULL_54_17 TaxID=1798664 RepID=A0A1G2DHX2_9BACT|nr:MAG: hypothetical protein A2762_05050 [Candidatus Lloydbacteria bacterium RIFCSPHIGHO2_01_FULL_54_11]OGZ13189.1 MAG: hypothetical protein A3C93_00870 [Candidatus Lloydbacteria bacterium RIFCSPHIGHO2_02_FULL_54_17]OGZ16075.1 MAG: hypothetical protein A3H76_01450 [Candidatus Lloydbacteria bacterium RIFCSPLOWO2_02_FULL_54_12]